MAEYTNIPLGFQNRSVLSGIVSIMAQQRAMQRARQQMLREEYKESEKRINESVNDLFKFSPKPVPEAYKPFMQTQTAETFDLASKVRARSVNPETGLQYTPQDLEFRIYKLKSYYNEIERINAEIQPTRDRMEKSGNYHMDRFAQYVGGALYNKELSAVNGVPTLNDPTMVNITDADFKRLPSQIFNDPVMVQKFVKSLNETYGQQQALMSGTNIPGMGKQYKVSGLPDGMLMDGKGQKVMELNPFGNYKINASNPTVMSHWGSMGRDYQDLLVSLATEATEGKYETMTPQQKEAELTKAFQKVIDSAGYRMKVEEDFKTLPDRDKSGTDFDVNFIGGSQKAQLDYMNVATWVDRLIDPETRASAVSTVRSPIFSVTVEGDTLKVKPRAGKIDQLAAIVAKAYPDSAPPDANEDGSFSIPISEDNIQEIVNLRNSATTAANFDPELVRQAYLLNPEITKRRQGRFDKAEAAAIDQIVQGVNAGEITVAQLKAAGLSKKVIEELKKRGVVVFSDYKGPGLD